MRLQLLLRAETGRGASLCLGEHVFRVVLATAACTMSVTVICGNQGKRFELVGEKISLVAVKEAFGLRTVELNGVTLACNQADGLTYSTFQAGQTIVVTGEGMLV